FPASHAFHALIMAQECIGLHEVRRSTLFKQIDRETTMIKALNYTLCALVLALGAGCSKNDGVGGAAGEVTSATRDANQQFADSLNLGDQQDFEDAKRGFMARPNGK